MRITVITAAGHPVCAALMKWQAKRTDQEISIVFSPDDILLKGDLLFLISCPFVVGPKLRQFYKHTLVCHASDLPRGRGWSPHIHALVNGANEIIVTMFEAVDKVDAGDIWHQEKIRFEGHELAQEINEQLFETEIMLMDWAVEHWNSVVPRQQSGEPSYYAKRTPDDSKLDPNKTIAEQFDLLRVADPDRYPAFFDYRGCRYELTIRKKEK